MTARHSQSSLRVVLGVTGGIAAYKAVQVARLLVTQGHEVTVIPTHSALQFVGKPTWEAISRRSVPVEVFDGVPDVTHVALGQQADLVIVAPAMPLPAAPPVAPRASPMAAPPHHRF